MTNYSERIAEAGGPGNAMPVLQEAMADASRDLEELLNKWHRDLPILLAAMRAVMPHMERFAGAKGVALADALGRITGCIAIENR